MLNLILQDTLTRLLSVLYVFYVIRFLIHALFLCICVQSCTKVQLQDTRHSGTGGEDNMLFLAPPKLPKPNGCNCSFQVFPPETSLSTRTASHGLHAVGKKLSAGCCPKSTRVAFWKRLKKQQHYLLNTKLQPCPFRLRKSYMTTA